VLWRITPYALLNSSVLRWLQKQDDDEDKSGTAAGREFQAAGPLELKVCNAKCYTTTPFVSLDRKRAT